MPLAIQQIYMLKDFTNLCTMTYFLQKTFEVDENGSLALVPYFNPIIRPCKLDYDDVLKFFDGKMPKDFMLELGGQAASYCPKDDGSSIEEWLVSIAIDKGIVPVFEEWNIETFNRNTEYNARTIDLKTKRIIYDNVGEVVKTVKKMQEELTKRYCF